MAAHGDWLCFLRVLSREQMGSITRCLLTGPVKKIRKPKPWKHTQPITKAELMKLREEF